MTRAQEIRHESLLQLYGARPLHVAADKIRKIAKRGGFDYSEPEIIAELEFLVSQGHADRIQDTATGVIRYRITGAGTLHWENNE